MEILPNVEIRNLGLFIDKKVLVISDLHIGFEEYLNKKGVLVPLNQFKDLYVQIKELMKLEPEIVVINGDLKHEFGEISNQEWRDTLKIIDLISQNAKEIILVKGNHDTILGPIARKRSIEIVESFRYKDILFVHGDKEIETDAGTRVIGHIHPSVFLKEGNRVERYKCFLKGQYKGKNLIVMPAFSLLREGTDVITSEFSSPYINDLKDFEVFVVGDKVYYFGDVSNLSDS